MCVDVNGVVVGIIPPSKLEVSATGLLVQPAQYFQSTPVTISTQGVTPQSKVFAWLVPNTEWDVDDLTGYSVSAVAKQGGIEFCIYNNGPIVGSYSVFYFWS